MALTLAEAIKIVEQGEERGRFQPLGEALKVLLDNARSCLTEMSDEHDGRWYNAVNALRDVQGLSSETDMIDTIELAVSLIIRCRYDVDALHARLHPSPRKGERGATVTGF